MAQYTRFEVYVPVVYTTLERDPDSGDEVETKHSTPDALLDRLVNETLDKYRGITEFSRINAAPYKGWWQKKSGAPISVDYLTFFVCLVEVDQTSEAVSYFNKWKAELERDIHQHVILVLYYPVQTIGDFF